MLINRMHHLYGYLLLAVGDIVVFFGINPTHTSAFFMMVAFLLLVGTLYVCALKLLLLADKIFASKIFSAPRMRTVLFMTIVFLAGLQSIGQLTLKDVLAVVPLVAVGYFYLTYPERTAAKTPGGS